MVEEEEENCIFICIYFSELFQYFNFSENEILIWLLAFGNKEINLPTQFMAMNFFYFWLII
jgi:hypothetical protein